MARRKKPLSLKLKVWTDADGRRWIVSLGFGKDFAFAERLLVTDAQVGSTARSMESLGRGLLSVYAFREDDTQLVQLTVDDWDRLPVSEFLEVA